MEKLNRKILFIIIALFVCNTVSSCRLFKKKCDCPKFGQHTPQPATDNQHTANQSVKYNNKAN